MDSALVIKVKYSDTLRRFTAYVDENGLLDLDMAGLKMKIHCLFRFSPDADLTMTYIDEDKDEVTLVDDDDLCNATRQNLNPLRINVQLSSIRDRGSESKVNKSYAPKGPARVERLLIHIVSNDNEISKSPEEPMPNVLSTLSHELTTKATSLLLTKFMECLSKLELSKPGPVSESQDGASLSREELTSNFSMCPKVNKDLELPEINAKLVDPAPTKLLKVLETGCMAKPVENSTPPSAAPVDINADHPRDSTASAFSNLNFPDPASASDVLSHNNEEKSLKENVVLTGKSIALESSTSITDVLTHVNLHPFQTSQISFSDDRGSFALNCENIKKHPGGTEQFLASQANVDPAGKLPDLGFMTGDKSLYKGFNCENIKKHPGGTEQFLASQANVDPAGKLPDLGFMTGDKSLDKGFNGVDSYDALPSPYNARFSNKSYSNSDSSSRIFHKGIQCDGCGVYPIMGPRFKSKVKKDFDLCNICFLLLDLGNEAEYIRLDRPISHQAPWCSINFRDHSCGRRMFDSRLYDLSIMGSTVIAPNVRFTKKWRMCNSGAAAWPHGTELVWIGGDRVTDRVSVEVEIPVEGFLVDKELDIGVDFTAPIRPGHYVSYWKMSLPSGLTFGQCILVHIQVDASLQGSAVSFHGINLNVPANTCMVEEGKEINDMDNSLPEAGHFEVTAEVVKPKPVVDDEPTIGNVVTPGVDSSKVPSESFITSISPEVVKNSNEFEQALIRELEQMGFKQIDLNKEILRMNAYDLEQSIADLCGLVE